MQYSEIHREVVEGCLRGERKSQSQLYHLYAKGMYNVCMRMLQNDQEAEDVLQNAFVDIFGKLHTFKFESSIGAWIKRIVVNKCINQIKSRRLKIEEMNEGTLNIEEEQLVECDMKFSVQHIRQAMSSLPDGYRIVFSLYAIEGYDHEEISKILGVSLSTSKSQYSRARKKLRDLLENPVYA